MKIFSNLAIVMLLLSAFLQTSCLRKDVKINLIGDVKICDSSISVKNWLLRGPFLDQEAYIWNQLKTDSDDHDFKKAFETFYSLSNKRNYRLGRKYQGKFMHFYGRDQDAVYGYLDANHNLYNFNGKVEFTIQFNIKLNPGENNYKYINASILSKQMPGISNEGWDICVDGGAWKIKIRQKDNSTFDVPGAVISDTFWHTVTIVMSINQGIKQIKTYTDNDFNKFLILSNAALNFKSNAPLSIGHVPGIDNDPADFYMSDLKIWNKALAESMIEQNSKGITDDISNVNLVGYWPQNEGVQNIFKNHFFSRGDFVIHGNFEWRISNSIIGRSLPIPSPPFSYVQEKEYTNLNKVLKTNNYDTNSQSSAYAACRIRSSIDQDAIFLIGIHDAAHIWLNGRLILSEFDHGTLSKNQYAVKIHLKKGDNNILMKLYNFANGLWGFTCDICSVNYARKYAYGGSYFSISDHYLITKHDSLSLRIKYPSFIPSEKPGRLQIINTNNDTIKNKTIISGHKWNLPLKEIKTGSYKVRLLLDKDTLEQCFIFGDYKSIYKNYKKQLLKCNLTDKQRINIETLSKRFIYLINFGHTYQPGEWLDRKISSALFELGTIISCLSEKKEPFIGIPGLHLRGFRSEIDKTVDNYLIYIPQNHRSQSAIPIVIMMPYVTKAVRFTESWHLADISRIEFIESLSRKFGFAVLWPSSRVYQKYSLNSIVSSATFEAINAVKSDYNIDESRMYLYGDCSGGLQALLLANRFPSLFAAIGVEGPELSYTTSEYSDNKYPALWTSFNNLISKAENYRNIPTLILHTPSDEKASFGLSSQLTDSILKHQGSIKLNNMNNVTKTSKLKMIDENRIMTDIMDFFKGKQIKRPDTITYATYQLKYDRAYWITLNNICYPNKASIRAIYKMGNEFEVSAKNINSYTIDLSQFPDINKNKNIKVITNHIARYFLYPSNSKLNVELRTATLKLFEKNRLVEGPQNDLFAKKFIVVNGTLGNIKNRQSIKSALDTFSNNWTANYFQKCIVKKDVDITKEDILNSNLLLIGSENSNLLIKRVIRSIPLKINKSCVKINHYKMIGRDLCYSLLYPNPLNNKKYILIIGTNSGSLMTWDRIKDMPLRGWYDFEIWHDKGTALSGYFDQYWN